MTPLAYPHLFRREDAMLSRMFSQRIGLKNYDVLLTDAPSGIDIDLDAGEIRLNEKATVHDLLDALQTCREHEYPQPPGMQQVACLVE